MQLYQKSEELVKLLEQSVQTETVDSFKSQYQTLLQEQRNASALFKSIDEAKNATQQMQGETANYSNEFASESYVSGSSLNQAQTDQQEGQAQQQAEANLTQDQKSATFNQKKEAYGTKSNQEPLK